MPGTTLITAPADEPVALDDAKLHLRVDIDDDDDLIEALIIAAREYVEAITRRALITQTWDLYLDEFPAGESLALPYPALQSVTGVYYTPDGESEQTFSADDYEVDTVSTPGRIVLASDASWPGDTLTETNGVRVRFIAGYGDDAADVPQAIRQAMLMLIGHWYENREATVGVGSMQTVPFAVEALLWTHRCLRF